MDTVQPYLHTNDDELEMRITVEIDVPPKLYDEARQAADNSEGSVRDHLFDRIAISPRFLVEGSVIEGD